MSEPTREQFTGQLRTRLEHARDMMTQGQAYIPTRRDTDGVTPRVFIPNIVIDVMQQQLSAPRHLKENNAAASMPLLVETIGKSANIRETMIINGICCSASDYLIDRLAVVIMPRMCRAALDRFADAATDHMIDVVGNERSAMAELVRAADREYAEFPQFSVRAKDYENWKIQPKPALSKRRRKEIANMFRLGT